MGKKKKRKKADMFSRYGKKNSTADRPALIRYIGNKRKPLVRDDFTRNIHVVTPCHMCWRRTVLYNVLCLLLSQQRFIINTTMFYVCR